jgi:hypothetical protein
MFVSYIPRPDPFFYQWDPQLSRPRAGARLAFGGRELEGHTIPEVYGAMEPTAVVVPLHQMLASDANWELATTELFGPFQVTACVDGAATPVRRLFDGLVMTRFPVLPLFAVTRGSSAEHRVSSSSLLWVSNSSAYFSFYVPTDSQCRDYIANAMQQLELLCRSSCHALTPRTL